MACSRKALTSGYNYLSRRFHPSFLHIVKDDRDLSGSPQPLQHSSSPLIQRASSYSRPSFSFRSADRDWRRIGFALPFGIHQSSRNFSSDAEGSNEVSYIKDVADVLTDAGVDTGIVAATSSVPAPFPGEVAAAAADSFLPVAALQHLIDAVHSFTGLNWWASIALTTVLIRGATVPLLINQLKATMKLNTMRPEMEKLKEEINNNMNPETLQENQKRMKALFKKHGVTPFTPLKGLFIQGPVFISFFMAISNMVEKVPSFKGGGAYWFTDLTTPDAMYIFPVLTALTFLATVELNMQEGLEGNPMANTMKKFSRGIGILTIPFTANFPKAIFCYWVTSNLFSLVYGFVLKRPPVRKYLNLPDVTQINPTPSTGPNFFSGGSKPALPMASSVQEKGSDQPKSPERRVSSSTVISQRIRNLEKTVKSRNKPNKKR
ncbi:mitochondrial inner membrane protein OXA1-like [Phalaenopsis equestris]|uniref:mitochondrial inner membrane protein OXA1-like n=1 Tax=Phalaenopsis equestris TaxID=78828 RepID=UPI0009E4B4DA|nr:mitochondrial inner membrane protein OXA1-like [Phalaenopsis equestris]